MEGALVDVPLLGLATALYGAASGASFLFLLGRLPLKLAKWLAYLGWTAHTVAIGTSLVQGGALLPWAGQAGFVSLLAWVALVTFVYAEGAFDLRAIGALVLPVLTGLGLLAYLKGAAPAATQASGFYYASAWFYLSLAAQAMAFALVVLGATASVLALRGEAILYLLFSTSVVFLLPLIGVERIGEHPMVSWGLRLVFWIFAGAWVLRLLSLLWRFLGTNPPFGPRFFQRLHLLGSVCLTLVLLGLIWAQVRSMTFLALLHPNLLATVVVLCLLAWMVVALVRVSPELKLPRAERYERTTFQMLQLGFGFLSAGIIAGMWWSHRAWGSWVSWNSREILTLLVWAALSAYLQWTRLKPHHQTGRLALAVGIGAFMAFLSAWVWPTSYWLN